MSKPSGNPTRSRRRRPRRAEPQACIDLVTGSREPLGRDEAAAELGISRELAAFHLDRLVGAGLLDTEYRRSGSSGPGPAAGQALSTGGARCDGLLSAPPLRVRGGSSPRASIALTARRAPRQWPPSPASAAPRLRLDARRKAGSRPSARRLRTALLDLLGDAGYAPEVEWASRTVCLGNCPYHALAARHRTLTCGMNLAWGERSRRRPRAIEAAAGTRPSAGLLLRGVFRPTDSPT